ncbi:peptidase M24, structural domain-containing protein, partial [Fomitopsis serialis]|uniref:peptidase M24, structural domain-containing protein n=1 Tax=Fomitopsis serialis TaxID=139415 RepID=UPI0020082186
CADNQPPTCWSTPLPDQAPNKQEHVPCLHLSSPRPRPRRRRGGLRLRVLRRDPARRALRLGRRAHNAAHRAPAHRAAALRTRRGRAACSTRQTDAAGWRRGTQARSAARLARDVLRFAGSLVKVGVTTASIDAQLHDRILSHNAYPSPLLYRGFPKSCCTSINNVVTHGIPDERPLQDGDIVNIDITVYKDGFHGDTSRTFLVGDVDDKGRELVKLTEHALEAAIRVCAPGRPLNLIGKTIHELFRGTKYSVSTQFTGHGIGKDFHTPPWILHHLNDNPGVMLPGHCSPSRSPCIVQGANPRSWIFPDGWTASTENCARSAQAEHMVLITDSGADVLTR